MLKKKETIRDGEDGGGSRKQLDKESEKRLKDFFSKKGVLEKRWKSFQSYRELKADAPAELAGFFEDNFYMVFTLLQDAVTDFSGQAQRGKRDAKYLEQIVWLLQSIVEHLGQLINRQWQTKALHAVICNLLYRENKLELRLKGLDIYMAFMTALRPPEDEWAQNKDTMSLLGQCLFFQPYVITAPGSVTFAVNPLEAPNDVAVWQPGGTVNEADADVLLKRTFDFVSKQTTEFAFWFSMLKMNVFAVLFPKVFQQMRLLPADQNTGFPECPPKLQRLVMTYLNAWMKDPKKVSAIWTNPQNAQLLLEVFSHALSVGTADADVSIMALHTFHGLFFSPTPAPELGSRLTAFRLFYLKKLPTVFVKATEPGTLAQHAKLCQEANRLVMDAGKQFASLDRQVTDVILAIPLNALTALFSGRTSSSLAVEIARDLVQATIRLWVVTQPDVSWKALQNVMAFVLGESAAAIEMVRDMLLQMTLILQRFYYPSRTVKESKRQLGAEGLRTAGHVSRPPDWRPPREAPEPDAEFEEVQWTAKSALLMWQNVRDLFVKINTIADPVHHAKAMEALVYVADYLLQQDAGVPFDALQQPNQPRPLELVDMFGGLLCEALELPEAFDAGRAVAAGGLCRLFCRQADPVPLVVLQYLYAVVERELSAAPLSVVSGEIIANTTSIFALGLPGAMGLIPCYVRAIQALSEREAPDLVARGCITIVCSLICYPTHFRTTLVIPTSSNTSMSAQQLLGELTLLLLKLSAPNNRFVTRPEHVFMVMCGLVTYAMMDSRSGSQFFRKQVAEFVNSIVARLFHPSDDVAIGAAHCLAALAQDQSTLDPSLSPLAVQGIATAILGYFRDAESDKKFQLRVPVAIAAFEALEEWVLAVPSSVIEQGPINKAIFAAIEVGLFGTASQTVDKKGAGKKQAAVAHDFATLRAAPLHGSRELAEVAEVLLRSLLNLHDQWPGPGGPEFTGTVLRETNDLEKEDTDTTYFFANGSIVSLVPQPDTSVRIIIRDEADRYAWDARVQFADPEGAKTTTTSLLSRVPPSSAEGVPRVRKRYNRIPKQPPSYVQDEDATGIDKVEETLKYLSEVYDDCKYDPDAIAIADEIKPLVEETVRLMDKQQEIMVGASARDADAADGALALPVALSRTDAPDPFHNARLLLSHFNMVDYDQRAMFSMLECGTPLQRSINTLDAKRAREAFKIGVIYVRRGQDSQEQILKNDVRSEHYDAFIKALAWEVNMATHRAYNGGLDQTKFLTGTVAPYFATMRLECVFHDLTLMPTDTKDEQQIHKKRHVGNDVVNIVYSEHVRDYDPSTISTQFNCAHVILYPLPNGLTRVQVCRKEEQVFPLFGPLMHNMCVTSDLLPILARQTSLNANRNFTSHKAGYLMPFPNRAKDSAQLLSRYKVENADYSKTIACAFGLKP